MSKTPGRKLFRSPFPIDPQTQIPGPQSQKSAETTSSEVDRRLADRETQKTPTLASVHPPANQSAISSMETQKSPVPRPDLAQDKNLFLLNALKRYNGKQINPALPPNSPSAPQAHQKKKRRQPLTKRQKILLIVVALITVLPSLLIIFELISMALFYRQMQDGIAHLQTAGNVFYAASDQDRDITNYFNSRKIALAQKEVILAHADFASLSDALDHEGLIALASNFWPEQIKAARALGHIANAGTDLAQQFLKTMQAIAPSIAPALQKSASSDENAAVQPYLTSSSYQQIQTLLSSAAPLISSMRQSAQGLSLESLPISSKQRELVGSLLTLLPTLDAAVPQIRATQAALGWFLGIDSQRSFLIEPMDSAELRASGGFTGQFGELTLHGAHVGPIKLSNIGVYEEDHTGEGSPPDPNVYPKVAGQTAPKAFVDWWPVANFGLRDANLSADFPTSARIAMDRYSYEFGHNVDGVIMFTSAIIKHVLEVTGPLPIPAYKRTITAQNLESLLHYYQLDNTGISEEQHIEHVQDSQIARKLFTQRVTRTIISTVTHLPLNKMIGLLNMVFLSMKSKDLQIYVTNPQLESLIGKYGSTASLDRSQTHDGLFIVQSNLSASKASQYVTTTIHDTVILEKQGGATHQLQMTLDYQKKGDVYGFDTYRDYIRIYVPPESQLLSGNGFDQYAQPYCGDEESGYTLCQPDVYGDGSLVCRPPITIGYATSYLNDPYAGKDHPLDVTGLPSNLQSDETGRAMFGGWVVVPKDCTMKVTLSWYVPPTGKSLYTLLLQSQASVYAPLDLTIQPATGTCSGSQKGALHLSRQMEGKDISFTLRQQGTKCSLVSS